MSARRRRRGSAPSSSKPSTPFVPASQAPHRVAQLNVGDLEPGARYVWSFKMNGIRSVWNLKKKEMTSHDGNVFTTIAPECLANMPVINDDDQAGGLEDWFLDGELILVDPEGPEEKPTVRPETDSDNTIGGDPDRGLTEAHLASQSRLQTLNSVLRTQPLSQDRAGQSSSAAAWRNARFMCFDVFSPQRPDMPFRDRLKIRDNIARDFCGRLEPGSPVFFCVIEHFDFQVSELDTYLEHARRRGFEGIVVRRFDSAYRQAKSLLKQRIYFESLGTVTSLKKSTSSQPDRAEVLMDDGLGEANAGVSGGLTEDKKALVVQGARVLVKYYGVSAQGRLITAWIIDVVG